MNLPIRARVTIWYVALLAGLIAVLGVFVVIRLRSDLVAGVDASLDTRAAQIALGYQGSTEGEFQDVSDASLRGLPGGESAAQLLDAHGTVLETSGDPAAEAPMITTAQIAGALHGATVRDSVSLGMDGEPFRILAVKLPGSPGNVVVVATSLDTVDASVNHLTVLLLLAGPALLVVAGFGGWWLAKAALAPVTRMSRQASGIGIEGLDERVDVPATADEIHDLAVTMNAMLDRLERGVRDQRRFVADASHELRTPLAVMRSELEVSMRDPRLDPDARTVLASVQQEVQEMGATVEDMLTLARADEGQLVLIREPLDLLEVVSEVGEALAPMADSAHVDVRIRGSSAPAVADRRRMEQVVRNLLANAIRYVGSGGHVVVDTWADDVTAGCVVRDDGPGISSSALPHVFDRFYRADTARTGAGSGLGLAICREILTAHRGEIRVESDPGMGSEFVFTLPRS
ncbi:MAG: HAMP domain-containing sensor histidine kinase [Actinomycetota bacterium]